ncbi:hypothetical protein F5148DRAFT_1365369 [Russula earlei]|uniref:Uncharacterized protein n=1 Tax=Russula earlei TaxID=71964 RepID=A0ACC0UMA6_9AGAM|nr:hypothetical protein F5148DRAFT_1365369 [Russula earlei]
MYTPTFPPTEVELNKAGLLGTGVSEAAAQVARTMKEHPELLKLSLFALECINLQGQQYKGPSSPHSPCLPSFPNLKRLIHEPVGRFAHVPIKSLRGVFGTPLNKVWDTVGPQIRDIIKARKIQWSSIDPARFFTQSGRERRRGVLVQLLSGSASYLVQPPLTLPMMSLSKFLLFCGSTKSRVFTDATHYVRRFLTPLLAVSLTTEDMEEDDSQGTLTLWFHENKDDDGNPSDRVYGVSNCHVLRKNTTVNYVHKGGAAKDHVRVCGMRRFQRGLDEVTKAIAHHVVCADLYAQEIIKLQANGDQGPESAEEMERIRCQLDDEIKDITDLQRLHGEVTKYWSNIKLDRNIGHVEYAPAIKVDQGRTQYTADWAAFLAEEAKIKDAFEGNVVDLGSKYSSSQLTDMFYPLGGGPTTFKNLEERKLKIFGCATKEDLAVPTEFDNEGQRCLMVGKDGNTTDLTVGRYAGLESLTNADGVESMELAIYNLGIEAVEVFADKGDSGSLVWHMKDGKARIVGQLHSGRNKGGLTSFHVTYCTPGWWLLAEIKKKYKNAVFYPDTWPVRG